MKLGLIFFTPNGEELAQRLQILTEFEFTVFQKELETAREFTARCFGKGEDVGQDNRKCDGIVYIGAAGIAVRMIAPHIDKKMTDPAVLVMGEQGQYIIPILSGHIGGGNVLANRLSSLLGATPVITTATDINKKFAVDLWSRDANCAIVESNEIKVISAALLRGEQVGVCCDFPINGCLPDGVTREKATQVGFVISLDENARPFAQTLRLVPRIVTIGAGCRRDTDSAAFERFVLETLAQQNISLKAVARLVSIDLKQEEACLLHFCKKHSIPFETYPAEVLAAVEGEFTPSAFVKKTTGVDNVCERSAMIGGDSTLLMKKASRDGMTLAIGRKNWSCEF